MLYYTNIFSCIWKVPGLKKFEAETPFIEGLTDPIPGVTIRTDTDNYLLEFHFLQNNAGRVK